MDQRNAYIVLNMIEGLGTVGVRRLIDTLGSPRAILEADREALMEARGVGEKVALKIITQRDSIDAEHTPLQLPWQLEQKRQVVVIFCLLKQSLIQ